MRNSIGTHYIFVCVKVNTLKKALGNSMKPPICAICFRDFRGSISEGGLVRFKLTDANIEYNKRFEQPGFVGHKAGQEWFCKKHYVMAKKYSDLTLSQAIVKIKS